VLLAAVSAGYKRKYAVDYMSVTSIINCIHHVMNSLFHDRLQHCKCAIKHDHLSVMTSHLAAVISTSGCNTSGSIVKNRRSK